MPITAALVGSVAAPLVGGVIGNIMGSSDADKQKQAQLAALQAYQGVTLPDLAAMKVDPSMQAVQGTMSPQMQALVQQNQNAMQGINTDPRLMQAQMGALAQLQQQGQGGLTAQERNVLQTIANQVGGASSAANKSILANMQARGLGGSGIEMANQQAAAQGAANQAAQQSSNLAGQSQANALQAMMGAGNMGAGMQQQQFGQQAAQAQAQNAINQFNAANRQNVNAQNTGAQNQAQYYNLQNAQNVANANAATQNQSKYYNSGLNQQQFQDAITKAGGVAGGNQALGNYYGGQAQATRGMGAGIGNALGTAAGQFGTNSALNNLATSMKTTPGMDTSGLNESENLTMPAFGGQ
jgi:hypothetical protein